MPTILASLTQNDVAELSKTLRELIFASDNAALNKRALAFHVRFEKLLLPPKSRVPYRDNIKSGWPSFDVTAPKKERVAKHKVPQPSAASKLLADLP